MLEESVSAAEQNGSAHDLQKPLVFALSSLLFFSLFLYYFPTLGGQSNFYYSDITYFFEPFCHLVGQEIRNGRFPLWNPYVYCGMSQIAMPNPGLFYPGSWLLFLLPFSQGLSIYMIFHQLLAAWGSYLLFREMKASRASALFGALAVALCSYSFSLIRNFTLPASISWLPIALYLQERITNKTHAGRASWKHMLFLALVVSMIVQLGRPEVGLPALLLIALACSRDFLICIYKKEPIKVELKMLFFKLAAMALGFALALPTVVPGMEWTSLSPRAYGLAKRWVLTWSANWYDFLGVLLAQPLGNLCPLDKHHMHLRQLVLSRGAHAPFLDSAYVSILVLIPAIWALEDKLTKFRLLIVAVFLAFVLLAAGEYLPVAPALLNLSPSFALFRYPVKLLIFPCLLLIYLAVQGLDSLFARRVSLSSIKCAFLFCLLAAFAGVILFAFPQIGEHASKIPVLFHGQVLPEILHDAQSKMALSIIASALLGIFVLLLAVCYVKAKLSQQACISLLALGLCATLMHNAMTSRILTKADFFADNSFLAESLRRLAKPASTGVSASVADIAAFRYLNLYFDPISVPKTYQYYPGCSFDQSFFQYSRQMLLYETGLCQNLHSSGGYEAAETSDYKNFFADALAVCSQHKSDSDKKAASDAPMHRFAVMTATKFVNTQKRKSGCTKDQDLLDKSRFVLVEENAESNYRIYEVTNPRPRFYFTRNLVLVDSFGDVHKLFTCSDNRTQTEILDNSKDISYVLKRDREKQPELFNKIGLFGEEKKASEGNSIKLDFDNGQELRLSLTCTDAQLLVISDRYYPGWKAYLDGKEIAIIKANIVNRAVACPAGNHKLLLRYEPQSLQIGLFASSIAAFLFLVFAILSYLSSSKKSAI